MTRFLLAAVLAASLLGSIAAPLYADNAPLRPSPEGLMPGQPDTTVSMASERVDIQVTERDGAVHALVDASFDMLNHGSSVTMTVGFPRFNNYLTRWGFQDFDPAHIDNFQASSGATRFQPTVKQVNFSSADEALYAGDWYVWDMTYPGGATTNVRVSYDQTLDQSTNLGLVRLGYVLRTGALWNGPIGEATITMSSDTGGVFLSPQDATSAEPHEVVWRLVNAKPDFDPYTFYVPGPTWQALQSAQQPIAAGSATAADYAAATEAFVDAIGRDQGGLAAVIRQGALPAELTDRYDAVRGWAQRAVTLAPTSAAAYEALGDMDFAVAVGSDNFLSCRPQAVASALVRAVQLGSPTAQSKLDDFDRLIQMASAFGELSDCEAPSQVP